MNRVEDFKELAKRPFKSGEVVVFRLWSSSYYPSWDQRFCEDDEKQKWWWEQLKKRNIRSFGSLSLGEGGSRIEGELWVFKLWDQTTADGLLFLAQMHLHKLHTSAAVAEVLQKKNKPVPEFDLSLVSTRALAPNFQQVVGMSNSGGTYPHIYTVDDEGSKWSHHVEQNWRD